MLELRVVTGAFSGEVPWEESYKSRSVEHRFVWRSVVLIVSFKSFDVILSSPAKVMVVSHV